MTSNTDNAVGLRVPAGNFLKRVWGLAAPYWRSEEKRKAWTLLIAVLGLSLFSVAVSVWFNGWYRDFYNALEKKDFSAFGTLIAHFTVIAMVAILAAVYRLYLTQMLTIHWRRWLTEQHFARWLGHKNYYQLETATYLDNPDQRISEDINSFTSDTLSLGLGFVRTIVSLVSFSVILWGVSGSAQVAGFDVPGYMFWVALAYAAVGSWLTHIIGRRLIPLSNLQQRYEANLRFSMVRIRENAESIALSNGEPDEHRRLSARFGAVWENFWQTMRVQKRLTYFTSGYDQLAVILPLALAAPRYFAGKIELGELMQISSAFGNVQESMSWFISAYTSLASWRATCDRLLGFHDDMAANETRPQAVEVVQQGSALALNDVALNLADGRQLVSGASLQLAPGERLMLSGPSGSGKSSLLRAMGRLWPDGAGRIVLPGERYLFLPQKPYLPIGPLRESLSYPAPASAYTDQALIEALRSCRLDHLTGRLDDGEHWQRLLSPGEQQRLAFARALLYRPRWLFMDEATSAMDEEDEALLYELLIERLPGVGIVSVGHRSTLKRFHPRLMRIGEGRLLAQ